MKSRQAWLMLFGIGLIWSAISPHDYFTWALEIFPAVLGLIVLIITYSRFKFTNLIYLLILVHSFVLFVGGHYTYAEVPVFNWIKEICHQNRNNYDKVGHFIQGFVPAMIARELFVRKEIVKKGAWLSFIIVCVCMGISASYEYLEWFVAICSGESADSFLGTQGYEWDTQSDMLFATFGAISALMLLSKVHDKELKCYPKLSTTNY